MSAVGVIVAVRAPAPWLDEALRSVLAQDPAPAEVVVVDDASFEPVTAPAPCRVVRLSHHAGPGPARDAGLRELSAPLVALCDADDAWLPGKLGAQLEALERNPNAALCFGRAEIVGADGQPTGERWPEPPAGPIGPPELARMLYAENPIPNASVLIRRDALEAAGGFTGPARLAGDWDLWLRLARTGATFVCEPRARIRYRRHAGGLTRDLAETAEAALAVARAHADLVDEVQRSRVQGSHLTALARGRVRRRDYTGARDALAAAARLRPPAARERALAAVLQLPGARRLLGRREPYGRA